MLQRYDPLQEHSLQRQQGAFSGESYVLTDDS